MHDDEFLCAVIGRRQYIAYFKIKSYLSKGKLWQKLGR
jgi:hypothetical protein